MIRKIIKINQEKCNGCGACAEACHEGAIGMINGKAKLLRDDYCDGLGDCLPACPTGAITFEEREADAYSEEAVAKKAEEKKFLACGCPGIQSKKIDRPIENNNAPTADINSELTQWPVQIKLLPIKATYFENANLLVAADCVAYAYGNFHKKFMKNKAVVIGCPKLDNVDYALKLTEIIKNNNIKSVTVVKMEVPCCGGIENAVKTALLSSGKFIPWQVITVSTDGRILD